MWPYLGRKRVVTTFKFAGWWVVWVRDVVVVCVIVACVVAGFVGWYGWGVAVGGLGV